MKGSMTAAEISQSLTLDTITSHSWHVQACCALTGEGCVEHTPHTLSPLPGITADGAFSSVSHQFACQSGLDEVSGCRKLGLRCTNTDFLLN